MTTTLRRRRRRTEGRRTTMTTTMPMMPFLLMELPSELFLHVLIRLPLKYLMGLGCVSKFFLDLINNPDFITSYCKSNPSNKLPLDDFNFMETSPPPPPPPPRPSPSPNLISCKSINQWPWRFHMLFKGSYYIYIQKRHELIPFHCPNDKRLINSINGLVCYAGIDSLEIYNIFAGTNYYLIPKTFGPPTRDPVFVFGYDPISKDYKILIMYYYYWSIYSFVTNTWEKMTFMSSYFPIRDNSEGGRSVCINGVIYWPPRRPYLRHDDNRIEMFDLHKKKFGLIPLPKEDLLLPTQYYADIQLLSFRGCLAFAIIKKTSTTTTRKRMRSEESGGGGEGEGEKATSSSDGVVVGEIWVELLTLTDMNLSKIRKMYMALKNNSSWKRQSFVFPIPSPTKQEEVEIVSCCDEIFLGWFESNQLRLYNLHTKRIFNLPLSTSPSHYYPKASFMEKKKDNPTYVDNLSFDFSLI